MQSFSATLRKFENETMEKATLKTRAIALEIFKRIILKTPVKTGRARGNWQCSVAVPAQAIRETEDQTGSAAISEAVSEVLSWEPSKVSAFLTNNLPYIERLEDGYSQQAPSGMVAVTLAEVDGIVSRVV